MKQSIPEEPPKEFTKDDFKDLIWVDVMSVTTIITDDYLAECNKPSTEAGKENAKDEAE